MHWAAILVVDDDCASFTPTPGLRMARRQHSARRRPFACVEIFGRSILERITARMIAAGAQCVSVIAGPDYRTPRKQRAIVISTAEGRDQRWFRAQREAHNYARQGLTVLIGQLGVYTEFDIRAALAFHVGKARPITSICDAQGPLGYWITNTAPPALHREFSFVRPDSELIGASVQYVDNSYANHLADAHDFRRLVRDSFLGRCEIVPSGREIKPAVWVADGKASHKTAQLEAPVYVGHDVRLRPTARVTQFSNIERHCEIGDGTAVVDSSVLADTGIGGALHISSAVVDRTEITDLQRKTTVSIEDPRLLFATTNRNNNNVRNPAPFCELEASNRSRLQRPDSSLPYPHLARAAGRLLQVLRGEL